MSRKQTSVSRNAEQEANGRREILHNYDVSTSFILFTLFAIVADAPAIEAAKADLSIAMDRLKFVLAGHVWNGDTIDSATEVQRFIEIATKHGAMANDVQRIPGLFETVFRATELWAKTLKDSPEYASLQS